MSGEEFWNRMRIPVAPETGAFDDVEPINPADVYRKQATCVNDCIPLYVQLEEVSKQLRRRRRQEAELVRRVLSQSLEDAKGTHLRTNELVDAYTLAAAKMFEHKGEYRDISGLLLKLRKLIASLEADKEMLERRISALNKTVEVCDAILNWIKHQHRMELSGVDIR